jgi:hypothetical protein
MYKEFFLETLTLLNHRFCDIDASQGAASPSVCPQQTAWTVFEEILR